MIFDLTQTFYVFYLLIPAIFANMAPVLFTKVNFLNYPVDFKKSIGGKRILGDNKTFRGFFFGIIVAIVLCFIKIWIPLSTPYNMTLSNFWYAGFLLGFGALFGDVVESFVKRRLNIKPGKPWIPFDEIDHVIGSSIAISIVFFLPILSIVWIVLIAIPVHILINLIAFWLKLRKDML